MKRGIMTVFRVCPQPRLLLSMESGKAARLRLYLHFYRGLQQKKSCEQRSIFYHQFGGRWWGSVGRDWSKLIWGGRASGQAAVRTDPKSRRISWHLRAVAYARSKSEANQERSNAVLSRISRAPNSQRRCHSQLHRTRPRKMEGLLFNVNNGYVGLPDARSVIDRLYLLPSC